MAGNPFDAFDPPAAARPAANPFDAFDEPAAPAAEAKPAEAAAEAEPAEDGALRNKRPTGKASHRLRRRNRGGVATDE